MLRQRPLGQTSGKTSHSFTSGQGQKKGRGPNWSCPPPGVQNTQTVLGEAGRGLCQPQGLGYLREELKEGISASISKDFRTPGTPHNTPLPVCSSQAGAEHRGTGSYLRR